MKMWAFPLKRIEKNDDITKRKAQGTWVEISRNENVKQNKDALLITLNNQARKFWDTARREHNTAMDLKRDVSKLADPRKGRTAKDSIWFNLGETISTSMDHFNCSCRAVDAIEVPTQSANRISRNVLAITGREMARSRFAPYMKQGMGYQEVKAALPDAVFDAEEESILEAMRAESNLVSMAEGNWIGHAAIVFKLGNRKKHSKRPVTKEKALSANRTQERSSPKAAGIRKAGGKRTIVQRRLSTGIGGDRKTSAEFARHGPEEVSYRVQLQRWLVQEIEEAEEHESDDSCEIEPAVQIQEETLRNVFGSQDGKKMAHHMTSDGNHESEGTDAEVNRKGRGEGQSRKSLAKITECDFNESSGDMKRDKDMNSRQVNIARHHAKRAKKDANSKKRARVSEYAEGKGGWKKPRRVGLMHRGMKAAMQKLSGGKQLEKRSKGR